MRTTISAAAALKINAPAKTNPINLGMHIRLGDEAGWGGSGILVQ
jgi:hypothetical protein